MPSTTTVDLKLDNDEDQPRRLTRIGSHWIAYGGDDGTVSLITGDSQVQTIRRFDDAVRAVAASDDGKRVVVGLDSGSTQVFCYDDYQPCDDAQHPFCPLVDQDNLLSQADVDDKVVWTGPCFDAPLRDLAFQPGTHLVAAASESGLALVDTATETSSQDKRLSEEARKAHDASGIRSMAWNPSGTHWVSLALDGRACVGTRTKIVWRDETKVITKQDPGEILGADAYDRSCRALWVDDATVLLPGESYLQVRRLEADGTVSTFDQTDSPHSGTIVSIRPTFGDLITTTARDGKIVVWKRCEKWEVVLDVTRLASPATDLAWINESTLYAACASGSLAIVKDERVAEAAAQAAPVEESALETQVPAAESDDHDFGASTQPKNFSTNPFVDDEAEDNEDAPAPSQYDDALAPPSAPNDDDDMIVAQDSDDDDNETKSLGPPPASYYPSANVEFPEPQAAFAPSSTPLDLARRFMCWNHVGSVVYRTGSDLDRNTVDVDFTDSAFRRPISFSDNMGFIVGSLGEDGALFATALDEDDEEEDTDDLDVHLSDKTKALVKKSQKYRSRMKAGSKARGSTLYFHRYETFGSNREKDWYLGLPDGELVLGCSTGEGWAATITSRRFLRLFSSGGNQGKIFWLKGEPVTIAGRGRFVAAFYHEGMPLMDGTQKLGYLLLDAQTGRTMAQGSVSCVSSASSLSWAGFDNEGSLLAMDTDGMVSMLVCSSDDASRWEWMPMLDTVGLRKSSDDSFWPITAFDGKLISVPLKGGTKFPDATRKPVTTTLNMRIPLARGTMGAANALEEVLVRADIALGQKKAIHDATEGTDNAEFEREYTQLSAQVDKVSIKMFAAAVESNKLERALDLVERFHLEKSHDIAMQLAGSHVKLAELIEDVKERKFGAPKYEETPADDDSYEEENHSSVTPDANGMKKRDFEEAGSSLGVSRLVRRKQSFA